MAVLTGKVAVITGASAPRGLGRAIAHRFAREGASLFLVADETEQQLLEARGECQAAASARAEYALYDLAVPGQPEAMIANALQLFGRVDVLVNNAGLRAPCAFDEVPREVYDRVMAVNVAAPFFASQAVVPAMRRQGGGRIVNVASQLGTVAFDRAAVYSVSKAALIQLTRSMAYELAKENILVNAISPGPTLTQYIVDSQNADPALARRRVEYCPIGRLGQPEEIAELALFLATAPGFLVGANILIDGGYTLH